MQVATEAKNYFIQRQIRSFDMPSLIGDIRNKWLSIGGASSVLGQPLTDELTTPDGIGRFNHFQGGSIYWTKCFP